MDKGSLVLVHMTARVKDTGEVIETTMSEDAKKLGVYDESRKYEPRLVAVGESWVLKGVDEALAKAEIGKKITVEVPPEKAFGARDPEKVRRIPLRKFGDKADELAVGDEVDVDNRIGLVRFIGSGRAQVDFNHRYAGKVLVYDLKPEKELTTSNEKIIALIRRRLPVEAEKISLDIKDGEATVKLPQDAYLAEGLQIIKRAASTDIFKHVSEISKVNFIETYETPKPKEAEKPAAEKPTKAAKKEGEEEKAAPEAEKAPAKKAPARKKAAPAAAKPE
ncbi:MAG: peptidylprolyl isomerase [Thaumarchaeota archaeon]|nr:peptidylprolyl isomerase [Nitrososphaerota archaeon]MCL5318977.1 peptidylprolyl isomerase [Nitrososphaerota archaeon]